MTQTERKTRLQMVLDQLPDCDKYKITLISQHYGLDPDDPAFLAVLAVSQGVEALEQASQRTAKNIGDACDLAIQQSRIAIETTAKAQSEKIDREIDVRMVLIDEHLAKSEGAVLKAIGKFTEDAADGVGDQIVESVKNHVLTATESTKTLKEAIDECAARAKDVGVFEGLKAFVGAFLVCIFVSVLVSLSVVNHYTDKADEHMTQYQRLGEAVAKTWGELPVASQKLISKNMGEKR